MSMSKLRIVCAGMCNTKRAEIRYLARQVAGCGGQPCRDVDAVIQ